MQGHFEVSSVDKYIPIEESGSRSCRVDSHSTTTFNELRAGAAGVSKTGPNYTENTGLRRVR